MNAQAVTLGVLAGGAGSRLGGVDKAWLERDGAPQVLRWVERFGCDADAVLVSANRGHERYRAGGLTAIADSAPGQGPLGGLHALAHACRTPWLLTLPVDVVALPSDLLPRLRAGGVHGACARDDDGLQPLVALWPVAVLRRAADAALAEGACAAHALVQRLALTVVPFAGMRFGNLNTPDDLRHAGAVIRDE
ncbi:MAG TPA: molybdenum cofactor guanylyltransferase [Lysobacter sp.]|nr:molybdenum cofactor guanylyltransferase [Lysobacter sp.]